MQGVCAIIGGENAAGLVTLNGRALGDAPATAALGMDGDCYLGLMPDAPGFYGVTRKLTFEEGRLTRCPPDVQVYDWGGLYEILLRCGALTPPAEKRFPYVAARMEFFGALAVLYYEDGLWLSLERGGRVQTGYLLHPAASTGELTMANRQLIALAHGAGRDACLALDEHMETLLRLEADRVTLENGLPVSVERLDSLMGWERRTRWCIEDDAFMAEDTETGFFTAEPAGCGLGERFLETLLYGGDAAAEALLSPALGLGAEAARAFLGAYDFVRLHPSEPGRCGIARLTEGVTRMRVFKFETEGNLIVNITTES